MDEDQFEVRGNTYKAGKIDARKAFHLTRRVLPIITPIIIKGAAGGDDLAAKSSNENKVDDLAIKAMMEALSEMTDEDADYVLFGLLKAVSRKQPNGLGWGPVISGTSLMYEDINVADMFILASNSVKKNIAAFFGGLPSDLQDAVMKATSQ